MPVLKILGIPPMTKNSRACPNNSIRFNNSCSVCNYYLRKPNLSYYSCSMVPLKVYKYIRTAGDNFLG